MLLELAMVAVIIVTIGAIAVFILQVLFWISLIVGDNHNNRKQDSYEAYLQMKRDEFFLNDGYKGKQP